MTSQNNIPNVTQLDYPSDSKTVLGNLPSPIPEWELSALETWHQPTQENGGKAQQRHGSNYILFRVLFKLTLFCTKATK
jgi:hypothetical protein